MHNVINSTLRAFASLRSGALLKMLLLSMALNAALLAALVYGIFQLLTHLTWFGEWDWLAAWGLTGLATLTAYFVFPLLLPLIISFFDTAIADAIEREEYPNLPDTEPPYWPTLAHDIKFVLKAIGINILILPLYLIPGINFFLYYLVNGYLISIEFFNVVAGRHIRPDEAEKLQKHSRLTLVMAGTLITFCSTIPFVNLIAPMIGVAMMVHFFHALRPDYKESLEGPEH